jgi:hypothetical protein
MRSLSNNNISFVGFNISGEAGATHQLLPGKERECKQKNQVTAISDDHQLQADFIALLGHQVYYTK